MNNLYVIEELNVKFCLIHLFPVLISGGNKSVFLYINTSHAGLSVGNFILSLFGLKIEKFNFRISDIKDTDGRVLWWKISHSEMGIVQKDILKTPIFDQLNKIQGKNRVKSFIGKQAALYNRRIPSNSIWHAIALTRIIHSRFYQDPLNKSEKILFFMNRRLFQEQVDSYAAALRITAIPVKSSKNTFKTIFIPKIKPAIKYFLALFKGIHLKLRKCKHNDLNGLLKFQDASPHLATTYCSYLNLNRPELYSDLFFLQKSTIPGSDMMLIFENSLDPLDQKKQEEIKSYGIEAIVQNRQAANVPLDSVLYYQHRTTNSHQLKIKIDDLGKKYDLELKWLMQELKNYSSSLDYWKGLFSNFNIKIFITWYKFDSTNCVIADALGELGGISTIYQRALDEFPCPEIAVNTDIVFGFSKKGSEVDQLSGSVIPYYVITGYNGDHRFRLLEKQAQEVRNNLLKQKVKKIIGFLDENSGGDPRWSAGAGHEFTQKNYAFILEKVLSNADLGLIIKPKAYWSLRNRLGNVNDLLVEAEKTRRCIIFESGPLHNAFPPAIAALASDVVIHGHLYAATAGFESALAGTPTLLMDREGIIDSTLYKLGENRVVFKDWEQLWEACKKHWDAPGSIAGFGDWSPLFNELDPFRDGKAAERIGTYLNWLLEGFKAKLPREIILSDAAERYCKIWGKDKIISINNHEK